MKKNNFFAKFLSVIAILVIVVAVFVVPCLADSVLPNTSGYDNIPFSLSWSGVPLNSSLNYDLFSDAERGSLLRFYVDDLLNTNQHDISFTNLSADNSILYDNKVDIRVSDYITNFNYDLIYHASGSYEWAEYSYLDEFKIRDLFYIRTDDIQINTVIQYHICLPVPVFNTIGTTAIDEFFTLRINTSYDGLLPIEEEPQPEWYSDLSRTIEIGKPNLDNVTHLSFNDVYKGISQFDDGGSDGFRDVVINIPLTRLVNSDVYYGDNYSSIFVKDMTIKPLVFWDSDDLYGLLESMYLNDLATQPDINAYYNIIRGFAQSSPGSFPCRAINVQPYYLESLSTYIFELYGEKFSPTINNVVDNSVRLEDFSLTRWLGNTLGGILDVQIMPGISLSILLYVVLGVGFIVLVLKYFAGG